MYPVEIDQACQCASDGYHSLADSLADVQAAVWFRPPGI